MKKYSFLALTASLFFVIMGCEKDRIEPISTKDENIELRSVDCFNFRNDFEGCADDFVVTVGDQKLEGFGAIPTPGSAGTHEGFWASAITEITPSGKGAAHYTLKHIFWIDNDNYFYTDDRAVCAPAKGLGATCMINDQMTIVGGKGLFEFASGKIKTHGTLTFFDPTCPDNLATLSLNLHGRICMN